MVRTSAALLAASAAILLAACGSSPHTTTAPVPTIPTTSSAGRSTTTTTTSARTTTTTVPAGTCRASALKLSFLGQQGATGHGELGFALRNVSGQQCDTLGYPGILFLDKSGAALPTSPMHTTHDLAGHETFRALTVLPGQSVSFRLFVTHFGANGSSAGCATAYGLQVIPPNDTASLRVAIGDGGATECRTVTVTPLQPGTTAYP
jgi:hypothetical protein